MIWNYKTPGILDELFERTENVPITKEDVRSYMKMVDKDNNGKITL